MEAVRPVHSHRKLDDRVELLDRLLLLQVRNFLGFSLLVVVLQRLQQHLFIFLLFFGVRVRVSSLQNILRLFLMGLLRLPPLLPAHVRAAPAHVRAVLIILADDRRHRPRVPSPISSKSF